ncbi:hypothetical protein [Nocardiopsis sp. CC223A]|uniref:hypothetical protein n=1 Tax=Nocardiopsis sp. CC223A TaxID=3044051 RepID=UPI00278BAF1F|nr:hypothetical protein [Nocardiopsis sp. CC223A]
MRLRVQGLVPLYAIVYRGAFLLDPPADASVPRPEPLLLAGIAVRLAPVPLRCAAEEYAFRGPPQQAPGTWPRSPLWGIVRPVPLSMLGHGYDRVGRVDPVGLPPRPPSAATGRCAPVPVRRPRRSRAGRRRRAG